ncbi:MAG TPA: hypothetical protein VJ739_18185 [Gemmataceae bacterium]|nr:hypothetical protein [Gemmataceae bacterium]
MWAWLLRRLRFQRVRQRQVDEREQRTRRNVHDANRAIDRADSLARRYRKMGDAYRQ